MFIKINDQLQPSKVDIFHKYLKNSWGPLGSWEKKVAIPTPNFKAATGLSFMGETQIAGNLPKAVPRDRNFAHLLVAAAKERTKSTISTEKK